MQPIMGAELQSSTSRRAKYSLIAVGVLGTAAFIPQVRDAFGAAGHWAAGTGVWAVPLVALVFGVATLLFVPGTPLSVLAGAWFGFGRGFAAIWLGSWISMIIGFWLGRRNLRAWPAERWSGNARFQALDAAIGRQGWKVVALARLTPGLPFSVLNYVLGLTSVRPVQALLASIIGVVPGTLFHIYVGTLLNGGERSPWRWALSILGLVSAAGLLLLLRFTVRQSLPPQAEMKPQPLPPLVGSPAAIDAPHRE